MTDMEELNVGSPFGEFGNLLREERVRRGYTVDEVASLLKITSRMVRAIEDGDMDSMPHAVYARGFIRAYAKLLNIDEKETRRACQELRDGDEDAPVERYIAPSRPSARGGGGILGLLLVLCLIAGGAYWGYSSNLYQTVMNLVGGGKSVEKASPAQPAETSPAQPQPVQSSQPGASSGTQSPQTPAPAVSPSTDNAAQGLPSGASPTAPATPQSSAAPANQMAATVPAPAASGSTNATAAAPSASSTAAPSGAAPVLAESLTLQTGNGVGAPVAGSASGKRHQIILTALAECWVHSTADDMDTRQLSIQKGETFALSFDRKLVVKLGNAGGVKIKYDGKELPPAGKPGQVKSLVFPQDAAQAASAEARN